MKLSQLSLLALSASIASARFHAANEGNNVELNGYLDDEQLYLVELSPGETQWITEEDKWELRRVGTPLQYI
jgi:leucyl aminopeptidase